MKDTIKVFKALSDSTRLRLFLLLMKRDLCVCELTFILDMAQSRISHQLRILRDAGLVEDKREGRWIIYAIPSSVKKNISPFLRQVAGPDLAGSKAVLKDIQRIDLCLQENVRKNNIPSIPYAGIRGRESGEGQRVPAPGTGAPALKIGRSHGSKSMELQKKLKGTAYE